MVKITPLQVLPPGKKMALSPSKISEYNPLGEIPPTPSPSPLKLFKKSWLPTSSTEWLNLVTGWAKFPKAKKGLNPGKEHILKFPPFYQAYTFQSTKWRLKNYIEFLEMSFFHSEKIYFYPQSFTFGILHWTRKNTVTNKEHQNLSPRHQKQRWEMMWNLV